MLAASLALGPGEPVPLSVVPLESVFPVIELPLTELPFEPDAEPLEPIAEPPVPALAPPLDPPAPPPPAPAAIATVR